MQQFCGQVGMRGYHSIVHDVSEKQQRVMLLWHIYDFAAYHIHPFVENLL